MVNLILAGTQEEFEEWKKQHPHEAAVYIDDAKRVLGYEEEDRLIIYGTGAHRDDWIAARSVAWCLGMAVYEEGKVDGFAIDSGCMG
jgi:uncharacterized HAD superfamily protein